uniref:DUF1461 domain-containing protein n=1 Tax=Caldisericum exile TaxID=693075 RepID=A0A7C4XUX6_9BACT
MKYLLTLALVLIILLSPIFLLLAFEQPLFSIFYDAFNIRNILNLQKDRYLDKVKSIIRYFFDSNTYISLEGLSHIEIVHMYDVKNLIKASLFLLIFSAILLIVGRKYLTLPIIKSASITVLILTGFLFIGSLVNFDNTFYYFHKILFRNNYWLLDSNALLIKLFPENVFFVLAIIWFSLSFFASILLILL